MKIALPALAALTLSAALTGPAVAGPKLEIGTLNPRLELPGLRACYVARTLGPGGASLRFLTTGSAVFFLDPDGKLWPLLHRTNLFGVVTDPEWGALLCTSRGVYATRDGRSLRRLSSLVFTRVAAAPVGGLFARAGVGLYGFDGQQFQLVRPIPWQRIDSLAVEPDGSIWFVGTYARPDGSVTAPRLFVSRSGEGAPLPEDLLGPDETASAVAEYFGGIVATVNGELRGTLDGGGHWVMFDQFGRPDLTLESLPLFDGQPWQVLWIGVRELGVGPAPLWFDDYTMLVAQPINASLVRHISTDLSRQAILVVADDTLFEASYRLLDEVTSP
jgi:hypothetical protein